MPGRPTYHQNGDPRGAYRRADRHDQDDSRGQYPRPRDNRFAQQQRPRVPIQPPPAAPPPPPPQEETTPPDGVYTEDGAQYVKPQKPYVPGYMQSAYRQDAQPDPEAFDAPVQQADYIRKQNPYVVMSEKNTEPKPAMKRRTLIVWVVAAAVILAGVWISQLIFNAQTEAVFTARAAAEQAIADKHPFRYRDLIEREAIKNNLDPAFVAAIVLNESSFNPSAESSVGARGLMQMMEDTALWVYNQIGMGADYAFDLMYDAEMNVEYGCWYLNYLSGKFGGDPVLVAAAFHSGRTNVFNWLNNKDYSSDQKTIPLETFPEGNTKAYVQRVMNDFAAYLRLYYDEVTA